MLKEKEADTALTHSKKNKRRPPIAHSIGLNTSSSSDANYLC
jgi:hypothetical protein